MPCWGRAHLIARLEGFVEQIAPVEWLESTDVLEVAIYGYVKGTTLIPSYLWAFFTAAARLRVLPLWVLQRAVLLRKTIDGHEYPSLIQLNPREDARVNLDHERTSSPIRRTSKHLASRRAPGRR